MSSTVGHTYIYNIVILFILIVFAFLAGTLSYYKAFKVNNKIVGSIEKYEGFNYLSKADFERQLSTIGYQFNDGSKCDAVYKKMNLVSAEISKTHRYCIYVDIANPKGGDYYQYGVLTYMNIQLPIVSIFELPVFTRTNRIYKFST